MNVVHLPRYLREGEIEERTLRVLASYQQSFKKTLSVPPVPIHHLVEAYLGLRIDWDVVPEKPGERILAYIDPVEKIIQFNESRRDLFDQYFGSEQFTLAHEAGHWDLHVIKDGWVQAELPLFSNPHPSRFLCRANSKDRLEIQADMFAGLLLMPTYLVRETIHGMELDHWSTIEDLAHTFEVSKTAMRIRLENMNLIKVVGTTIHIVSKGEMGQYGF